MVFCSHSNKDASQVFPVHTALHTKKSSSGHCGCMATGGCMRGVTVFCFEAFFPIWPQQHEQREKETEKERREKKSYIKYNLPAIGEMGRKKVKQQSFKNKKRTGLTFYTFIIWKFKTQLLTILNLVKHKTRITQSIVTLKFDW